jgi:crotonobetainyl-CoA:carnitine CoA-transferase CaiB-like acyl-CoA transferase
MTVDLTREKGRALIYRLAEFSDVFVHNFRKGVPEKPKMNYETLSRFNPKLISILNEIFPSKTARKRHKILRAAGDIICTPVQTIYDLENDPKILGNEYIIECNQEVVGPVKVPGIPVKLSKTPGKVGCEAPGFGQHTEQILIDIGGYTWEDITRFKDDGII